MKVTVLDTETGETRADDRADHWYWSDVRFGQVQAIWECRHRRRDRISGRRNSKGAEGSPMRPLTASLLLLTGCATQDLPPLPEGYDQPTARRLVEAEPFMGPVQQQPGPSIAWQGVPGHTYFIEEMNRARPNEWTKVATNLAVDAESNGLWQTWCEGNWRVGVEQ